jgi:hypothetical protein
MGTFESEIGVETGDASRRHCGSPAILMIHGGQLTQESPF